MLRWPCDWVSENVNFEESKYALCKRGINRGPNALPLSLQGCGWCLLNHSSCELRLRLFQLVDDCRKILINEFLRGVIQRTDLDDSGDLEFIKVSLELGRLL